MGDLAKTVFGALIIALGIIGAASYFRYEIVAAPLQGGDSSMLVRLDRLTGGVEACLPWALDENQRAPAHAEAQPAWCRAEIRTRPVEYSD